MWQPITYNIREIFYSLQGEGFWTGTPAVFIRFAGCNLHCSFCDTDSAMRRQMTQDEILGVLDMYPSPHVILTGGEPALQIRQAFIDALHGRQKYIQIETNGTLALPEGIDWITISPKSLTHWSVRQAQELKLIFQGQDLESYYALSECEHYFLQPCSEANIHETIEKVKQCPGWRLSLQTHKLVNIP